MAHIKALVTIGHSSGVPENAATNTLHFSTPAPAPLPAELDAIVAAVHEFYGTAVAGTGLSVSALMSINVAGGAKDVKLYNMAQPPPRVPLRSEPFPAFGLGPGSFPLEVALVLSFRSLATSGTPLSRRRGRIYIGPLSDDAPRIDRSGGDVRPSVQARQTLAGAAARLVARNDVDWSVFSTVDGTLTPVLSGFVDNAYDTQRRRGTKATARTVFP